MFAKYLDRWALIADGTPIETHNSHLLPVRRHGVAAMLKVATAAEERAGAKLMAWWNGSGAAKVLAWDEDALLLERADHNGTLAAMARTGDDDEASKILCRVVATLHEPRSEPPPPLVPLEQWFRALTHDTEAHDGVVAHAGATTRDLLATQREVVSLHGDIHHGNVLHFGERGWLAIDPKGLVGDRCFDYANLFCNPDHETATAPGRFARQVAVVAEAARLERQRLLRWTLAWAGLSAAWLIEDGASAATPLCVAEQAARALKD
ncbi:MAG: aminoglycoside phosphotransferase family protein [Pseudomonadota bacterium]